MEWSGKAKNDKNRKWNWGSECIYKHKVSGLNACLSCKEVHTKLDIRMKFTFACEVFHPQPLCFLGLQSPKSISIYPSVKFYANWALDCWPPRQLGLGHNCPWPNFPRTHLYGWYGAVAQVLVDQVGEARQEVINLVMINDDDNY